MSVEIHHSGGVYCEVCNARFHRSIPNDYNENLCTECVETVVPEIDKIYEMMVRNKVIYSWYHKTFKLTIAETIAYKRYLGIINAELKRRKEQEKRRLYNG